MDVEATIWCSALVRRFGALTAVDEVSLEILRGEVFGLLGSNGCGKSTTIRMLTGLVEPTAGDITVAGVDVVRSPALVRGHIGYVAQQVSLYPNLRVSEAVEFYGGIYGLAPARVREVVARRAPALGIERADERALARDLPAGVRQRVAILLALIHEPQVIFLDEPSAGVDLAHRRSLFALLHELADEGITLLVTSHHLDEMERCSRLAFMDRGRILGVGTAEGLKEQLGGGRRYTLSLPATDVPVALSRLAAVGVRAEPALEVGEAGVVAWTRSAADYDRLLRAAADLPEEPTLVFSPPTLGSIFEHVISERVVDTATHAAPVRT